MNTFTIIYKDECGLLTMREMRANTGEEALTYFQDREFHKDDTAIAVVECKKYDVILVT